VFTLRTKSSLAEKGKGAYSLKGQAYTFPNSDCIESIFQCQKGSFLTMKKLCICL
jgi:hypothetical protein